VCVFAFAFVYIAIMGVNCGCDVEVINNAYLFQNRFSRLHFRPAQTKSVMFPLDSLIS